MKDCNLGLASRGKASERKKIKQRISKILKFTRNSKKVPDIKKFLNKRVPESLKNFLLCMSSSRFFDNNEISCVVEQLIKLQV